MGGEAVTFLTSSLSLNLHLLEPRSSRVSLHSSLPLKGALRVPLTIQPSPGYILGIRKVLPAGRSDGKTVPGIACPCVKRDVVRNTPMMH